MLEGCVPWPEALAARYRAHGAWEGLTISEMVERTARARAEQDGASCTASGASSYAELIDYFGAPRRRRCSASASRPLDRVVMQLPNVPEFVVVYLALQRIGAIPVMALARAPACRGAPLPARLGRGRPTSSPTASATSTTGRWPPRCRPSFPALRHVVVAGEPGAGQHRAVARCSRRRSRSRTAAAVRGPTRPTSRRCCCRAARRRCRS